MASTGINNGTLVGIYISGTKIAHSTSASISVNMATRDATTKDSAGWTDNLEAVRDWSIDGEFLFAENAAFGFTDLFSSLNSRSSVAVKFTTNVTGDKYYHGTAYVTSLSMDSPMEDNQSFTATFTGSGALTESTLT